MKEIIKLLRQGKTINNPNLKELESFENSFSINKYDAENYFIFEIISRNDNYFRSSLFVATDEQLKELIAKCQEALRNVKN